jgi:lipooligosaccharide transport system permease protein
MSATARVLEYNARVYRQTWRGGLTTMFLSPVLYLAAMGFGVGRFVDAAGTAEEVLGGVPYAEWLAPGLMAAQAMQVGAFAVTYTIMGRIRWNRVYQGMLATPVSIPGIVVGELGWVAIRLALAGSVFLAVMTVFGLATAPSAILAVPAAVLTGLAFAAPVIAFTATQRNDQGFNAIFRFGITPLFIFSGTFFPIEQLPELLRLIAYVTPLWHGVDLIRSLVLGTAEPALAAVHVAVLAGFGLAGLAAASVTFRRALER